ncbi:MAG: hypothetical protein INR71_03720, partial [Terriglobus roseus]|nr:hypothetical protein [Terriglobus roseus]
YPHELIDLGFLVGDTRDDTLAVLGKHLERLQAGDAPFRGAAVVQKDFNVTLSQDVEDRHGFEAQGPRRRAMGRARNYLLSTTLRPEHSWVFWLDVDVVESPPSIVQDFAAHDRDVLVPNIWFHRWEKNKEGEMVHIDGRCESMPRPSQSVLNTDSPPTHTSPETHATDAPRRSRLQLLARDARFAQAPPQARAQRRARRGAGRGLRQVLQDGPRAHGAHGQPGRGPARGAAARRRRRRQHPRQGRRAPQRRQLPLLRL